jgi:hypothetical protein
VAEKVTLAEAKALGFNSTKGITKESGMYKFAESLAPERGGFQSVGVAAPGQLQMTPYFGDVTGAYRLNQQQYAGATSGGKVDTSAQARAMQENEIKALVASGLTKEQATAQVSERYGTYGIGGATGGGAGGTSGSTGTTKAGTPEQVAARQSAFDILRGQFAQYGLEALVDPLQNLIQENVSPAEFAIRLRQTEPYKKRFAANAARIGKGLRALSEGEYLTLEDSYQGIMRNYGLPASYYAKGDLGRQEGFEKLIAGDVSALELEDRIVTAQKRVLDAAPEVTTALKQFYPDINNGDILAYTLDPEKGLTEIKRKITAAEIGGAALSAGLKTSLTDAEYLRRYGVTAETAKQGYEAIGGGLERGRQLASIYQQPDYTQAVAEEEIFNLPGQTEAQQKRKKVIGLEKATFGGQTGVSSGALSQNRAGSY